MMDDARLVQLARNGDSEAFAALAEHYRGLLYAAGYSVLGSRDEAEDVAQEAIVRIFAKIRSFREGASFPRWAYVIARNAAIARLRSRSREAPLESVEDRAVRHQPDDGEEVRRAVNALPERLREPVLMRYIDGYTGDEIGKALGIASGTVRSRLTEARRILRGELIGMMKRALSELISVGEFEALIDWLKAFPSREPEIVIEKVNAPLPDVDFVEGTWFFVPLVPNGVGFAAWYDHPERELTDASFMRVLGKTHLAGEECWEVCMVDSESREAEQYKLWYWAVDDDSVRMVATYFSGKDRLMTCRDADWDEDPRGHPRYPARLPVPRLVGDDEFDDPHNLPLAPIETCDVTIGGRTQRCLRVIEARFDERILVDAYINTEGRTVLFRRYNSAPYWSRSQPGREDWPGAVERLAELGNHRIVYNGVEYYHWYDCVTDTALQSAPPMARPFISHG